MFRRLTHRQGIGGTEYIIVLALILAFLVALFWVRIREVLIGKLLMIDDTISVAGTLESPQARSNARARSRLTNPFEEVTGGSTRGGVGGSSSGSGGSVRPSSGTFRR